MTSERLSWREIVEKYPDEWVGLTDVTWDNSPPNVSSAVVIGVSKSGYDLWKRKLAGENIHVNCTMKDNMFPLGFVGGEV